MPAQTILIRDQVAEALGHVERMRGHMKAGATAEAQADRIAAVKVLTLDIPSNPAYPEFRSKASGPFFDAYLQLLDHIYEPGPQVVETPQQSRAQTQVNGHSTERAPESEPQSSIQEDTLSQRFGRLRGSKSRHSEPQMNGDVPPVPTMAAPPAPAIAAPAIPQQPMLVVKRTLPTPQHNEKLNVDAEVLEPITLHRLLAARPEDVLLLDARHRMEFENGHISSHRIACIDPITLGLNITDVDIEDSLVIAPDVEVQAFAGRFSARIVVYYDSHSTRFPPPAGTPLWHLQRMLNNSGIRPVMLKGGYHAWLQAGFPVERSTPPPAAAPAMPQGAYSSNGDNSSASSMSSSAFFPDKSSSSLPGDWIVRHGQVNGTENTVRRKAVPQPSYSYSSLPSAPPLPQKPRELSAPPEDNLAQRFQGMKLSGYTPSERSQANGLANGNSNGTNGHVTYQRAPYPTPPHVEEKFNLRNPPLRPQFQNFNSSPSPSPSPHGMGMQYANGYANGNSNRQVAPPMMFSPLTGLENLGNTCYMNCVLQCLFGTQELMGPFLDGSFRDHVNPKSRLGYSGKLANEFGQLVSAISRTGPGYVAPYGFKRLAGQLRDTFSGYDQQDCQEFLTFLLDGLHEDLNSTGHRDRQPELSESQEKFRERLSVRTASTVEWERYLKANTSLIVDNFQGQYLSRLQCTVCSTTSTTYSAFCSLSLPIVSGSRVSILDCFNLFVAPEVLDKDDAWYCSHCQRKQRTIKTLRISRLPKILVVHLKRFKRTMFSVDKIEKPVSYPLKNLDLTRYWPALENPTPDDLRLQHLPVRGQSPPFTYDLYGVTSHDGSLKSGHYTAFVKNRNGAWYYFDDTNVLKVPDNAVATKNAYVLFYRRSTQPEGASL